MTKKQQKKKNNNLIVMAICVVALLIIIGIIILIVNNNKDTEHYKYIYLGNDEGIELDNSKGYIIKSYEEFTNYYTSDAVKESDFDDYNYAFVSMMYDTCSEENIKIEKYEIKNDKLVITVSYTANCGVCAPGSMYFLIPVDKDIEDTLEVEYKYKPRNNPNCDPNVAYKPIIYLYPENDTEVEVKLGNSNYLTATYPKYNNGWNVLAKPNGDLYDLTTNRYLYGLYWEGNNHIAKVQEDGFIVEGKNALEFLEEKLSILGLTEREADEFIIYWLPKLEENKYNYVRFETIEEINNYMPLEVTPTPDTVIRVLMDYKALDKPIEVKEQKLTTPERNGFTVVEWGGSIIK